MDWGGRKEDDDLTTYRVDEVRAAKFKTNFEQGAHRWVARRFAYRAPNTAGTNDGARLWTGPLTVDSPRTHWDVLYMRTRAYETRLTAAKRYYMHYPIELLSSSVTMSPAGFAQIDAGCLGCIYTGEPKFNAVANSTRYKWPNPMHGMVTYLKAAEVRAATGDMGWRTDGFYRVALVFSGDSGGHEASVEHVIPQRTLALAAQPDAGTGANRARLEQGANTPLQGDGAVRARFADYVCGDPFNWLVSIANPNRRRGALPLAVCDDDLADLVVADRAQVGGGDRGDAPDVVRGAHDHLFPVPAAAWLRVALVQIYMYLTYPGLPPLLSDDDTGSALSAQGRPLTQEDYDKKGNLLAPSTGNDDDAPWHAPAMWPKRHARFGATNYVEDGALFVLPGFDEKELRVDKTGSAGSANDAGGFLRGIPERNHSCGKEVSVQWLRAVLRDGALESEVSHLQAKGTAFPSKWTDAVVSARTGRVVMTEEKRVKLFRTLLRTVAVGELCEADVLHADLVQKATGFMLSEYEQMCARLEATRDDGTPLTSSDGRYAAWDGNSDGVYGATIRTRYPRGWRNPLFHWSNRRRHGFVQQPTVRRFLGAAMYGLSPASADTAAAGAAADVARLWAETAASV